jgi:hypothetical protein
MDKFQVLTEGITGDLVLYLSSDEKITVNEAMNTVYNSALYEKLCDKETGLYIESPAYAYSMLREELRNGGLVQTEI